MTEDIEEAIIFFEDERERRVKSSNSEKDNARDGGKAGKDSLNSKQGRDGAVPRLGNRSSLSPPKRARETEEEQPRKRRSQNARPAIAPAHITNPSR